MAHDSKARARERARKSYLANRERVIDRTAAVKQTRRALVLDYLRCHPCVDCGEHDPVVLDFDHREPELKSFSISNGIAHTRSEQALLDEIAKCDVRCANCHRRRTAKQFSWFKYREGTNDVAAVGADPLEG